MRGWAEERSTAPASLRRLRSRLGAVACGLLLVVAWATVGARASAADPGVVLDLERASYSVSVRDERSGEAGPTVPVVLGSPANPTPAGRYPIAWVILRPAWQPGDGALAAGARPEPSSLDTPMGVAKIPFADHGSIALHGGGDRRLLGRSVSGGCVRAADADILRLIAWLDLHGALGLPTARPDGEIRRPFQRPAQMLVR